MIFGSLFSGVGGLDLGLESAGHQCAWQVEIDPSCNQVLQRHWPSIPKRTDIRTVRPEALERVDLIAFGSPCQGLSVAGKQEGLRDDRSGLFFEAVRIVRALQPAFVLWENVPGALGSNKGEDFREVLRSLANAGALDICWRVLDAQWFGVPQRRRRIYLVADLRGHRAESVLFEPEGCAGNPTASRTERSDLAYCLAASARGAGDGHGNAWNTTYVTNTLRSHPRPGSNSNGNLVLAAALSSRQDRNEHDQNYVVANSIQASAGHHGHSSPRGDGSDNLVVAFDTTQITSPLNYSNPRVGDTGHPLAAGAHPPSIAFNHVQDPVSETELSPSLGKDSMSISSSRGVRRLTPRECERLQGWPDDWTRWGADGQEIADTHRYRMIGNGVAAPVAEWVGWRFP